MKIYERRQWEELQKYCPKEYRNLILKHIMELLIAGLKTYGDALVLDLLLKKGGFQIVATSELPAKEPERDMTPLKKESGSKPLKTKKQTGSSANRLNDHLKG